MSEYYSSETFLLPARHRLPHHTLLMPTSPRYVRSTKKCRE